jgi:RNA polymerase sigma-70 factor (ECF subfamily)
MAPLQTETDEQLVLSTRKGNRAAFETLVHRHQNAVYAQMLGRTADPERSQELTQEAFITAYTTIANLEKPGSFKSWVIGIGLNLARRRRREVADVDLLEGARDKRKTGMVELEHVERIEAVRTAVQDLPENYRTALMMHYFDGARGKAIGDVIGCSEGAVHMILLRARKALAEKLKAFAPGEEF